MEEILEQCAVTLADKGIATWSVQNSLLMLHTDSTSAQWNPDSIGVQIQETDFVTKVSLHPVRGVVENYQSWYFTTDSTDKLTKFFKLLGYSCNRFITV